MTPRKTLTLLIAGASSALVLLGAADRAEACGCFSPPDPSVPVVQAGERIVFAMKDGQVEAHIQVQYSGPAEEFGWLLPMPSIPEMELGSDELFAQIIAQTQPQYVLNAEYVGDCPFDPSRFGGGFGGSSPQSSDSEGQGPPGQTPLVLRQSVGPYDMAVLRADSEGPMFAWLEDNGFVVPEGTDSVVDPYIRPGAYFLALRLLKGNDAGDIQPVVVTYDADKPGIPIVLTSVAAQRDMGVQVWVMGEDRAIPKNYFHTQINDARIDWLNAGANYAEVVTDAVDEAEGHHSFVTEYAGSSSIMQNVLLPPGRFNNLNALYSMTDPVDFVEAVMWTGGWALPNFNGGGPGGFLPALPSQALAVLQDHIPVPDLAEEVTPQEYYNSIRSYGVLPGLDFDPQLAAQDLRERVVEPTEQASALFDDNSYMTRLFTTLSPIEMTKDPIFSFNPDLPEVSRRHEATITYYCGLKIKGEDTLGNTASKVRTEDGWVIKFPDGHDNVWPDANLPSSRYTDVLPEKGGPRRVQDQSDAIAAALAGFNGGGCSAPGGLGSTPLWALLAAALAFGRRRRRE